MSGLLVGVLSGVMGIGGWNGDSPAIKDYLARHKAASANGRLVTMVPRS